MIGYGRIAKRFIKENELSFYETDLNKFFQKVDAIYIASPHLSHYEYIKKALNNNKHVLCEKPMVLSKQEAEELYEIANKKNLVLLEAIKTAFAPCFNKLISIAKSGQIGKIKNIDATFTKLVKGNLRELNPQMAGGSVTELASYPLLAIIKLLGTDISCIDFFSYKENNVDLFTKINIKYGNAIATAKIGLGVKSEGDLIISGTKKYIYVPAPWWKTEYFEIRSENPTENKKFYEKFEGDGLRYELTEFLQMIKKKNYESYKLSQKESILIVKIIEQFINN